MRDDPILLTDPSYTPQRLLNVLAQRFGAANDSELASLLEFERATLSRIRRRKLVIPGNLLVAILDRTDMTIRDVRGLAGMPFDGGLLPIAPPAAPAIVVPKRPAKPPLSVEDVRAIRASSASQSTLAKQFNRTQAAISAIKLGKIWRNVAA